jgi:hypothetical protein
MLWDKHIKVFTDHANLIRDALGLTLDGVYQWRLLLEKYGPKIVYIEGIHNPIADAISQLEYAPSVNQTTESYYMKKVKSSKISQGQNWIAVAKKWCKLDIDINTNKHKDLNLLFAHHKEEEEIYPFSTIEIAEAHCEDQKLKINLRKK